MDNKTDILVVGYWDPGHVRHREFRKEFMKLVPTGKCKYVHLSDDNSVADLYIFFRSFDSRKAVFATDYAANHAVAPYFVTCEVDPTRSFIVFDSENEHFLHPGLPPVPAVAPSLSSLGERLATRLCERIRTGEWTQPLQERI